MRNNGRTPLVAVFGALFLISLTHCGRSESLRPSASYTPTQDSGQSRVPVPSTSPSSTQPPISPVKEPSVSISSDKTIIANQDSILVAFQSESAGLCSLYVNNQLVQRPPTAADIVGVGPLSNSGTVPVVVDLEVRCEKKSAKTAVRVNPSPLAELYIVSINGGRSSTASVLPGGAVDVEYHTEFSLCTLTDVVGVLPGANGSVRYANITTNKSWQLECSDGINTVTASVAVSVINPVSIEVIAAGQVFTSSFALAHGIPQYIVRWSADPSIPAANCAFRYAAAGSVSTLVTNTSIGTYGFITADMLAPTVTHLFECTISGATYGAAISVSSSPCKGMRRFGSAADLYNFVNGVYTGIGLPKPIPQDLGYELPIPNTINHTATRVCRMAGYPVAGGAELGAYSSPADDFVSFWNSVLGTWTTHNAAKEGNGLYLKTLNCTCQ